MKIRLPKTEMRYYRALKAAKAKWDEQIANSGVLAFMEYDFLCARIKTLRAKGRLRVDDPTLPEIDPSLCPAVGVNDRQCVRAPHPDPSVTGLVADYHNFTRCE